VSEAVASEAVAEFLGGLRYGVEVVGDCLGDWIPNGSRLVADVSEEVRPLRIVHISFRDGDGPWSSWMRETGESSICKILLARVPGAVLVGQLKPPVVCVIPETDIEAMHPIVGAVGGTLEMTDRDKAALVLIASFQGRDHNRLLSGGAGNGRGGGKKAHGGNDRELTEGAGEAGRSE
jgi:hypothetical protein